MTTVLPPALLLAVLVCYLAATWSIAAARHKPRPGPARLLTPAAAAVPRPEGGDGAELVPEGGTERGATGYPRPVAAQLAWCGLWRVRPRPQK